MFADCTYIIVSLLKAKKVTVEDGAAFQCHFKKVQHLLNVHIIVSLLKASKVTVV